MRFVEAKKQSREIEDALLESSALAKKALFQKILDESDFAFSTNSWSDYANKIDKKIGGLGSRYRFWEELEKTIGEAEIIHKDEIYKGVIYWRKATLGFFDGEAYGKVISLLHSARKQDEEYQKLLLKKEGIEYSRADLEELSQHRAQKESAHKLLSYLEIIITEVSNKFVASPDLKMIKTLFSDKSTRKKINAAISRAFDLHLASSDFHKMTFKPLDMLIGRNLYRALLSSFYEGAGWITDQKESLEGENLAKYGAAYAVMTLAGSFIEGILLVLPRVKKKIKKEQKTLGKIIGKGYLVGYQKSLSPEIVALLIIILYSRNLIHPANSQKIDARISIHFATFIYRLAEICAILLAQRHKRKNPFRVFERAQM